MTSQDSMKCVRNREVSAVMYNLKEQRVLEKCLQTLQLEQTYSMKLLEIGNREIKVQYKKLKDKVSKVRSHLPLEDISKFRELDIQGKLNRTYEHSISNSATKMAEASKRLNLLNVRDTNRRSTRSALPRISIQGTTLNLRTKSPHFSSSYVGSDMNKRNNLLSVDFPEDQHTRKDQDTLLGGQSSSEIQKQQINLRNAEEYLHSNNEVETQMSHVKQDSLSVQAIHSIRVPGERNEHTFRTHSAYSHSHSPFSSHVTAEKDARAGLRTAPAHNSIMRRLSQVSHDSIDSNLGENLFEERRLELLEEENYRAAELGKKTQDFLKQVDDYLHRETRSQQPSNVTHNSYVVESSLEKPTSHDSTGHNRTKRFYQRCQSSDAGTTPTYLPEHEYKERVLSLWKDMNKCRYLRLPDDKLDLSGINTLASDNLKLFRALRQVERVPLKEAWEN